MLRSAARRAREAQGHPAAADEKAPEAAAAALAAAPAPPPVEKRRRVTRAEEREREEIRPREVVAGEGGDDEGERGMDEPDSAARSADKLTFDDEDGPTVPEAVSFSYECMMFNCACCASIVFQHSETILRDEILVPLSILCFSCEKALPCSLLPIISLPNDFGLIFACLFYKNRSRWVVHRSIESTGSLGKVVLAKYMLATACQLLVQVPSR